MGGPGFMGPRPPGMHHQPRCVLFVCSCVVCFSSEAYKGSYVSITRASIGSITHLLTHTQNKHIHSLKLPLSQYRPPMMDGIPPPQPPQGPHPPSHQNNNNNHSHQKPPAAPGPVCFINSYILSCLHVCAVLCSPFEYIAPFTTAQQ